MGRFLLVVLVTLACALSWVAGAQAHFDATDRYTHRACPAAAPTRSDPVNVVFHAWGTWGRAQSQVESHAGWRTSSGTDQFFVDHGGCSVQHAQRASGEGSRFHIRLRGQHWDPALGWAAAGAVHHEDLVLFPIPCGHAVDANGSRGSGFDQGRNELEARFAAAGHATSRVWWGNTQSFKQCDGDFAASDGWTTYVRLHQVNHA
jgi:uncharacterized protein YfaP (DUF2135 family)